MSVFESLFSLSLTSPDDNVTSDPPQDDVPSFFSKPMEFPTLDRLLVTTFHLLQQHITSPPNAWQPALASMGMDQFRLVPPRDRKNMFWMPSRGWSCVLVTMPPLLADDDD